MFISEEIAGHFYVAELNGKGAGGGGKARDMLSWSLVPRAFNGKITRIPFKQVPRPVWRRAYHILIEQKDWK
jgi:hypothetical protein